MAHSWVLGEDPEREGLEDPASRRESPRTSDRRLRHRPHAILISAVFEELRRALHPDGVAVVMEATHLCMVMRGVQKQLSLTVTSAMTGLFWDDRATCDEFMRLIGA